MMKPLDRVTGLLADLRMIPVDFEALYAGKNELTPLESVEIFLLEQQRVFNFVFVDLIIMLYMVVLRICIILNYLRTHIPQLNRCIRIFQFIP